MNRKGMLNPYLILGGFVLLLIIIAFIKFGIFGAFVWGFKHTYEITIGIAVLVGVLILIYFMNRIVKG